MNILKYITFALALGAAMAAAPARGQDPFDNRPAVVADESQTLPTAVRSTTIVAQPVAYYYRGGYYRGPAYRYGYAPRYRYYGGPMVGPYPYEAYYYGGPRYYRPRPYYYPYDGTARVGPMRFYWR